MQLDALDQIAARAFDGFIVRKDLVRRFKGQYPVPTYVAEFLLGRYCASTDEAEIQEGLAIVAAPAGEPHGAGRRGGAVQGARQGAGAGQAHRSHHAPGWTRRTTASWRSCPACG